jgi:uncharacterized protein
MEKMILGKTGLEISRTGFGALPIQRVDFNTAKKILKKAYDSGITFFDTANMYTDSEEKIGFSLSDVRSKIIIATKSHGKTKEEVSKNIKQSLKNLKTDYIDLFQLHNPAKLPDPNDKNSIYGALLEAKEKGIIKHIGISLHKYTDAIEAAESGFYETIQYPLSAITSNRELHLINLCKEHNVGLIAMKGLCGGILTNAKAAFAFLRQYKNIVPIWGIQKENELDEFIEYENNPPVLDENLLQVIKKDREKLAREFCRGCGYCMPCPVDIPLPTAARMYYLLRRGSVKSLITDEWQKKMAKINDCTNCGLCRIKCPYHLNTPAIIKKMYEDYKTFL